MVSSHVSFAESPQWHQFGVYLALFHCKQYFKICYILGNIYIWENRQCIRIQPAHEGPIYSLISMADACLSGGKDGKVIFWNENMSSVIRELLIDQSSFMAGHPSKNLPCIRSIDFQVCSYVCLS